MRVRVSVDSIFNTQLFKWIKWVEYDLVNIKCRGFSSAFYIVQLLYRLQAKCMKIQESTLYSMPMTYSCC